MTNEQKTLTLTVSANSAEDFRMLLQQALYEIHKHLPPRPDTSLEGRQTAAGAAIYDTGDDNGGQTSSGQTEGSLGGYKFDLVNGPLEYAKKEQELFAQGYRRVSESVDRGWKRTVVYRHDALGVKEIAGAPPEIRDYTPKEDGLPF